MPLMICQICRNACHGLVTRLSGQQNNADVYGYIYKIHPGNNDRESEHPLDCGPRWAINVAYE